MAFRDSAELVERLAARLGPGGLTADPADLAPWLTDWRGRVTGRALALASPRSTEEAADAVRLATAAGVAIVPQGGNTSMVAGATPPADRDALLLSLRRMRAIRSLEEGIAVVEAGVVLADLHDAAAAIGRRFPLSLAAKGSATIGGLIATNAGGTQVLRFGTMRALTVGVEVVLAGGALFEGLSALRKDNRGYDLRQLLIGSEGTLGIVTAASLRLMPLAPRRAVAWAAVATPGAALALLYRLEEATGDAVESFEIMPHEALELVLRHIPATRAPLDGEHPWHLLIDVAGTAAGPGPDETVGAVLSAAIGDGLVDDAVVAASLAQADAFWRLRESVSEAERADGAAAKHDVSVPVAAMPGFLDSGRAAVERAFPGARVLAFGHLGDGNVHFNVRPPPGDPAWLEREGPAATRLVHDLTIAEGGSISAEHGIGQTKLAELQRTVDPVRLGAMRAIKQALDPQGLFNPGKLLALAPGAAAQ